MTKPKKLSDFRPQRRNANLHTPRGLGMLDNSIAKEGWIGAITVAADGETFDGSARLETVYSRFGEDVEPIIVRSNGDRPIIHIREDIPTAEDERAVKLAIAANRIAQVDLNFDAAVIEEIAQKVDLSDLWGEQEFQQTLDRLAGLDSQQEAAAESLLDFDEDDRPPMDGERFPLAIVLTWAELQEWKQIKKSYGETKDTKAFLKLMRGE